MAESQERAVDSAAFFKILYLLPLGRPLLFETHEREKFSFEQQKWNRNKVGQKRSAMTGFSIRAANLTRWSNKKSIYRRISRCWERVMAQHVVLIYARKLSPLKSHVQPEIAKIQACHYLKVPQSACLSSKSPSNQMRRKLERQ